MNISQVGTSAPIQPEASLEAKRAALQSMLLRKTLENQQQAATDISREFEGKGQTLDIRC